MFGETGGGAEPIEHVGEDDVGFEAFELSVDEKWVVGDNGFLEWNSGWGDIDPRDSSVMTRRQERDCKIDQG